MELEHTHRAAPITLHHVAQRFAVYDLATRPAHRSVVYSLPEKIESKPSLATHSSVMLYELGICGNRHGNRSTRRKRI